MAGSVPVGRAGIAVSRRAAPPPGLLRRARFVGETVSKVARCRGGPSREGGQKEGRRGDPRCAVPGCAPGNPLHGCNSLLQAVTAPLQANAHGHQGDSPCCNAVTGKIRLMPVRIKRLSQELSQTHFGASKDGKKKSSPPGPRPAGLRASLMGREGPAQLWRCSVTALQAGESGRLSTGWRNSWL